MAEKISKVKKQLTDNEIATLLTLVALLFGIWLRLMPAFTAGFPMNDGGMFYTMIQDLRQNNYALPAYTTYNNLNIPYVYPPLPFYLAGFLADIFHVSDLTILLWLPGMFSVVTLLAFYFLARSMLKSSLQVAYATFFYACAPLAIDWLLMGGGLTRGPGQLGLILTAATAYRLFTQRSIKFLITTILSGALVTLSHPESALLAVISAGTIWLFTARSKRALLDCFFVSLGVLLIISPWLVIVINIHGIAPFLKASQTGGSELLLWVQTLFFQFTLEEALRLSAVLGLVGFFGKIGQKKYLLPAWVILPAFFDPRSSARASILPLALLASFALDEIILPGLARLGAKNENQQNNSYFQNIATKIFLGFVFVYLFLSAYGLDLKLLNGQLQPDDIVAMTWIRQNTDTNSKFVVLTGNRELMRNPIQEWFPALSQRSSQTTIQGREWVWGNKFIEALSTYQELESCALQDIQCVNEETHNLGISFDHIYIEKQGLLECRTEETCNYGKWLISELKNSPGYEVIYDNDSAIIFRIRN